MYPKFLSLSNSCPSVVFLKLDNSTNGDLSSKFNVRGLPTFLILKNGAVLNSLSGAEWPEIQDASGAASVLRHASAAWA